jgi:pyrroline-5-carboxylate reductase
MSRLKDVNLGFIGSGVMAEAMISIILNQGLTTPEHMIASDPREERGEELAKRYGVTVTSNNREAAQAAQIVVLSVKPQVLPAVLADLGGAIAPEGLVLSIVAGARIGVIAEGLGHSAIVRVMPNTPAQVGEGMSVWTATASVSDEQRLQAQSILQALGEEIYLEDEDYLDMATALSGTGPAYVFLFMEAMIDAGVHLGFSRRVARQLVLQTLRGSVEFARRSAAHPAELRNMVTSPGGTSAEALYQLEKGGFRTVLSRAIWAAYQKSKYLGELSSK